jgi:nucleoside-diphosphate-sugar epimerase
MVESGKAVVPSKGSMSFSHPRDIAQAMFQAASANVPTGKAYLVKSFDSTPEELVAGIAAAVGARAEVKKEGFLSSSQLPKYAAEQLRASMRLDDQPDWKELGYVPKYDLKTTCEEIASWFKKEPWATESA